jgi:hypothetical protein
MIKLTKRKGFNFFRSYYDVYNELETDADKVAFIDALLDRQFLGIKPTQLTGLAKFAYISQTNSIDSQVKGYEDKTKTILHPTQGGYVGGCYTPTEQVEVKEKVQVKEKLIINNIEDRKLKFASTLESYLSIYGKDLLNDFYKYWTEPNKSNTKFKQELEKTWSLERRLDTWAKNDKNFKNNSNTKNEKNEQVRQLSTIARSNNPNL